MSPNPRGNDQKLPIFLHWFTYIRSIDLTISTIIYPYPLFGSASRPTWSKPPTVSFSSFGPVAFLLLPSYFIPTKIPSFVRRLQYQPYKFSSMCFSIRFGFLWACYQCRWSIRTNSLPYHHVLYLVHIYHLLLAHTVRILIMKV